MSALIDDMLAELDAAQASMKNQTRMIAEISDKSNNILLLIEAANAGKQSAVEPGTGLYSFNKSSVQNLRKVIENFQHLANNPPSLETLENGRNFEQYLKHSRGNLEYLSSGVRKLLAVGNTVSQMKTVLSEETSVPEDEDNFDSDYE